MYMYVCMLVPLFSFIRHPLSKFILQPWEVTKKLENCKADNTARETFFTEVTGNGVSDHYDHYARNIHIKVFVKIAILCILVTSKHSIKP